MASAVLYSTEQVAEMLGLHVRTVRNYVQHGRLPAVRLGKQYRISHEDVVNLTGGRIPAESTATRVEVSAVVRIDGVDDATMARIDAVAAARPASDGNAGLHVQTIYDPERRSVKVVAIGRPDDTATLLSLLAAFDENPT